ncbi:hypothetical protein M427DRAFT_267621 [Gonapodya prolifera JEL478]|uniref:Uncharacterized protein n=1 Tax=Gonapodya prolifera (strain JEL478) TaxID=1344416 RepID=A0A139AK34_GONPJ|nr:hypothetical protein M427DRAFT_267621 [Gonapodya prolifera JEL478]|eukprot:KXS16914.1 hypothetical protein M427DRAFT_267621 [Gonapodya prolifera JEL478]
MEKFCGLAATGCDFSPCYTLPSACTQAGSPAPLQTIPENGRLPSAPSNPNKRPTIPIEDRRVIYWKKTKTLTLPTMRAASVPAPAEFLVLWKFELSLDEDQTYSWVVTRMHPMVPLPPPSTPHSDAFSACFHCGVPTTPSTLLLCTGCRPAFPLETVDPVGCPGYCSMTCQRFDWKRVTSGRVRCCIRRRSWAWMTQRQCESRRG